MADKKTEAKAEDVEEKEEKLSPYELTFSDLAKELDTEPKVLAERVATILVPRLSSVLAPVVAQSVRVSLEVPVINSALAPLVSHAVAKIVAELVDAAKSKLPS
jgi:hypothetical protein